MARFDTASSAVMDAGHSADGARDELLACVYDATTFEDTESDLATWEAAHVAMPAPLHRAVLERALGHAIGQCGGVAHFEDAPCQAPVDMLCCANASSR